MKTAPILLAVVVLAGCAPGTDPPDPAGNRLGAATLSAPEAPGTLPPAPPLWRIDPAMDESAHLLDGVPDDPEHGVPPSLQGLRASVLMDQTLQENDNYQWASGYTPPALSRDDFRKGSCLCVDIYAGGGAMNNLRMGRYRSAEKQSFWYASLRAKEAVYGERAEEAACERLLLEQALDVARGQWRNVFRKSPERENILANLDEATELRRAIGFPTHDEEWGGEDPEAAARLEWWLGVPR